MNDRSRPKAAPNVSLAAADSLSDISDIAREFAHWQAGFDFGRQCGIAEGKVIGADEQAERMTAAISGCTEVWNRPTQLELARLRNDPPITSPCSKRCKWCVICRRYAQWWREQRAMAVYSAATR